MTAIVDLDLVSLAAAIAAGDVTAETATTAAIDRAGACAGLNAIVALDVDAAIAVARRCDRQRVAGDALGPLHGVPLAHKDMFGRTGRRSGYGTTIPIDPPATRTATVLDRLDRAGAIDIGQLHMAEFALGPTGHNAQLGRCSNPWHDQAISGGSSSGSGAAVAARIVAGALGSDTGGSVRLPAAFCGVVGLKTTQGRLPMDGVMPLSETLDTIGPIARSSRDVALLMAVLLDDPAFADQRQDGLAGVTIGVPTSFFIEGLDDEVATALDEARRTLIDLGAQVVDIAIPDPEPMQATAAALWVPEAAAVHLPRLRDRPGDYGEQVRNRLLAGLAVSATDYLQAQRKRAHDIDAMLHGPLAACDMLLTPVCRIVTPLADAVDAAAGPAMASAIAAVSALTRPISYLGLPALTTPMGADRRGLPIGLQLVGRPGAEASLLRVGAAFEAVSPWLARALPPSFPWSLEKGARQWTSESSSRSATMAG